MTRILVIANPTSGSGRGRSLGPIIAKELADAGHDVQLVVTQRAGDAHSAAAADPSGWAEALVSVGGDGTFHEVLNGRGTRDATVGLIPLGTGNVLAKELGLPLDPRAALAVILRGRTRDIDTVELDDGRRFACMLCAGIDGRTVQLLSTERRGAMRMWRFVPLATRALMAADYACIDVSIDGKRIAEGISFVNCANTRSFGGPLEFTSDARCDDGMIDVLTVAGSIRMGYPTLVGLAFFRQVTRMPGARVRRASRVLLEAPAAERVPIQLDGEFGGYLPVAMTIRPRSLRVFAPDGGPPIEHIGFHAKRKEEENG